MVLLQPLHQRLHVGAGLGPQQREHMQFFVFVVQRRGDVEIAQHIARGLAGIGVGPVLAHMGAQAREQGQGALNAFVAGLQHGKGLLETHGRGAEARQVTGGGARRGGGHGLSPGAQAGPGG